MNTFIYCIRFEIGVHSLMQLRTTEGCPSELSLCPPRGPFSCMFEEKSGNSIPVKSKLDCWAYDIWYAATGSPRNSAAMSAIQRRWRRWRRPATSQCNHPRSLILRVPATNERAIKRGRGFSSNVCKCPKVVILRQAERKPFCFLEVFPLASRHFMLATASRTPVQKRRPVIQC